MNDDHLLKKQSRHDPGRWRVGDRHSHLDDQGVDITYVVTRIELVGNEEHVFGVVTGPPIVRADPEALDG